MKHTFEKLGLEVGLLVDRKNAAYGSSFAASGDFLRILFPQGVPPERFDDALLLVRIFDKQMRIATANDAFGESPYQDIAGYGLLGMQLANQRAKERKHHQCASARQDVAERSTEPNDSAASDASRQTTVNAGELNERRFVQPSTPPCANTSEPTAAPAPTATGNASVDEAARLAQRRCEANRCAFCDSSLPSAPQRWIQNYDKCNFVLCSSRCYYVLRRHLGLEAAL